MLHDQLQVEVKPDFFGIVRKLLDQWVCMVKHDSILDWGAQLLLYGHQRMKRLDVMSFLLAESKLIEQK